MQHTYTCIRECEMNSNAIRIECKLNILYIFIVRCVAIWPVWTDATHLFPSRLIKCGYCKLKCKSNSVSKSAVPLPPPRLPYDVLLVPAPGVYVPPPTANIDWPTEISCERNVRFELCIFTANDSDDKSDGNGASNDKRVIVSEHNLWKMKRDKKQIVGEILWKLPNGIGNIFIYFVFCQYWLGAFVRGKCHFRDFWWGLTGSCLSNLNKLVVEHQWKLIQIIRRKSICPTQLHPDWTVHIYWFIITEQRTLNPNQTRSISSNGQPSDADVHNSSIINR